MNRLTTVPARFAPAPARVAGAPARLAPALLAGLLLVVGPAAAPEPVRAQLLPLTGRVLDARTSEPIAAARIRIVSPPPPRETLTAPDGSFVVADLPEGSYEIDATRIGYTPLRLSVTLSPAAAPLEIRLEPRALPGPEVEVVTTRATERGSAVAFTELPRDEIAKRYWAQDIPMLLAETPGVYAYSDAGNGVGYSYVKIRGFGQRRVAVTINGVPLNDPESHEVYWVDHPDLLSSAENIQVQRGVGSALYGASAVGGSVNLETLTLPAERKIAIATGAGSFGTQRFSAEYQSGLLDGTYAVAGRYSRIVSQGYRDQSWSRLWSYYLSASRVGPRLTTRLNLYGGPEQLHLAYFAVDRSALDGKLTGDVDRDRRANPLTWRNQTDNFFEPHYELIQSVKVSDPVTLTSTAFYFPGKGYYDDLPYGPQTFASRHLSDFEVDSDSLYPASYYQTDASGQPTPLPNGRFLVIASDMTQRLWVRNRHYGWVPRVRIAHARGDLVVGGEWREHDGRHWGELTWSQALPPGTTPNHVFYDYTGRVNALSAFAQETFRPRPDVTLTGSLQLRRTRYAIGKDRYNGYDFDLAHTFLNSRAGVNWNVTDRWNLFGGYAHMSVEPILSEIYRADDPLSVPLFRNLDVANHVYEDPLIDPERLNDFEIGAGYRDGASYARVTGYWLDFRNEIVPNGQIDRLGNPITGNAARSWHRGVELEGAFAHGSGLEVSGNATLSENRFRDYREYIDATSFNDYSENSIAGFPARMVKLTLGYRSGGDRVAFTLAEVGRQYLDNSEDNRKTPALRSVPGYQHLFIEEHATLNGQLSLDLGALGAARAIGASGLALEVHALNLTGLRYETAGYAFAGVPYFYPAATRSVFASLKAAF